MRLLRRIKKLFFPERCQTCKGIIPFSAAYCLKCEAELCRIPESFCPHCNSRKCACGSANERLRHIASPFLYTGAVKGAIADYKFKRERNYAGFFSDEIFKSIMLSFPDVSFDVVSFVPVSRQTLENRGFNQSELLSRRVAKRLLVPHGELLVKSRVTLRQHYLSGEKRRQNPKGAFALSQNADVKNKTVLLCDDIKTTGSTLLACERALLEAGAKDVYCAVIAIPIYGNGGKELDKEHENI